MKEPDSEERNAVRVILNDVKESPSCDHGPMLLFERSSQPSKRFFACSAYRDRKQCSAYVLESVWSKKKSAQQTEGRNSIISKAKEFENVRINVLQKFETLSEQERLFCKSCGILSLERKKHNGHSLMNGVTYELLQLPSKLLNPLDESKKEAQYFFSDSSLEVILSLLEASSVTHILCLACPTVFENLKKHTKKTCLMLDLDIRFRQFYGQEDFLLYNMFNHHFFDGIEGQAVYNRFLTESGTVGNNLALVMDPPFGGKVDVLCHTVQSIHSDFRRLNNNDLNLSIFWIFPYFMESQITSSQPDLQMLDYKVEYENHAKFQKGPKGRKQGSPIRIFTNVSLENLKLPEHEGYHFCKPCRKWISKENRHCDKCNACTSKDGRTYVHCDICSRCVKPTWVHCGKCGRCALNDHPCELFRSKEEAEPKSKKRRK